MPARRAARDPLLGKTWVHVFEEDTPEGAVYRAEDEVPLSRRPRERLEFRADGTARFLVPGPDDRLVEEKGTWSKKGDDIVARASKGGTEVRVVERSSERLLVKIERGKPAR